MITNTLINKAKLIIAAVALALVATVVAPVAIGDGGGESTNPVVSVFAAADADAHHTLKRSYAQVNKAYRPSTHWHWSNRWHLNSHTYSRTCWTRQRYMIPLQNVCYYN